MDNKELNNKILNNVRNRIVVSNLEREEIMKINKKKQIISLCAITLIALSGSFFSVNAATDGKLVENIKEKYKEIVVNYDQSKYKLTNTEEIKDEQGNDYVRYEIMSNDGQEQIDIITNKENLEKEDLQCKINVDSNGVVSEVMLENKN